jgi:5S rRNA maturation endonuclease (ribonuclease M5)
MQGEEVASILSKWLKFQNVGAGSENLAAFCPFHKGGNESSPSMYVYVGKPTGKAQPGSTFCHTCNEGWTLSRLLYKLGADRQIVEMVRTELANTNKNKDPHKELDLKLGQLDFSQFVLPETLLGVYDYCPREMLRSGFTPEIIKDHDIGFDRDLRRITFPIRDHLGNLVGVSGRTVIDEEPRYKVYRSEFYSIAGRNYKCEKSKILWGLDKFYHARLHLPSAEPVILCEGFKAALWVKQAGFSDVVALFGAALSAEQHILLSRVASEAVLFLDNDSAGRRASWTISRQVTDLDLKIVDYGTFNELSPDDLSIDAVKEKVTNAPRAADWRRRNAWTNQKLG